MSLTVVTAAFSPSILAAVSAAEAALFVSGSYPDSKAERFTVPQAGTFPVPGTSGQGPLNYVPQIVSLSGLTARLDQDSLTTVSGTTLTAAVDFTASIVTPGISILAPAVTAGYTKYTKAQVIIERVTADTTVPTSGRRPPLNAEMDLVIDLVIQRSGVTLDVIKPYCTNQMNVANADRGANRFQSCSDFLYPLRGANAGYTLTAGDQLCLRVSHPINPKSGVVAPTGTVKAYLVLQSA